MTHDSGRFKRSSWEVLKVKICCAKCHSQSCAVSPGAGGDKVLSLHPGQPWKVPAGRWGQQVPGAPGAPRPARLILLRAQLAPELCMERGFALACTSALSPFIPLYSLAGALRVGWVSLMDNGTRHCPGTGVVQVCRCLGRVGTQENC